MSTLAKVFVVLNLVLAVAFLGAAAAFLGHSDNWKARHDKLEITTNTSIKDLNDKVAAGNKKVEEQAASINTMEAQVKVAKAAESAIAEAYAQLKKGYDESNASYQNASRALLIAQETIKNGRALVDQLQAERQALTDKLRAAQDGETASTTAKNNAENALELATNQLQDTNTKLATAEGELQRTRFRLEAIIRANPSIEAGTEQPWQQGKVLQADNEANIVVISLGSEDGVKAGFKYTVSRGSSFVAEIQITNVQTKSAAGKVLTGLGKSPIKSGDDVMTAR
jgi:DNA repair exonuclease SbcCD ATPase subunit